jgi:hypothetical protein
VLLYLRNISSLRIHNSPCLLPINLKRHMLGRGCSMMINLLGAYSCCRLSMSRIPQLSRLAIPLFQVNLQRHEVSRRVCPQGPAQPALCHSLIRLQVWQKSRRRFDPHSGRLLWKCLPGELRVPIRRSNLCSVPNHCRYSPQHPEQA